MFDQAALPWFAELNRGLRDTLDDAGFRDRIVQYTKLLDELALAIITRVGAQYPELNVDEIRRLLPVATTLRAGLLFEMLAQSDSTADSADYGFNTTAARPSQSSVSA